MCLYENKYNSMNNQSFCCVVWMSKQTTSDYEYEVRVILWMEDGQLRKYHSAIAVQNHQLERRCQYMIDGDRKSVV